MGVGVVSVPLLGARDAPVIQGHGDVRPAPADVADAMDTGGGLTARVPAWGVVMMSLYTLHRRPDYFPDPERFDPDRFTPEAEAHLPRHAYLPFGAGPRICIGNHFALMEGHLVLATLAQRVTFEWPVGQRIMPEPLINLRPKRGTMVRVRRRSPIARAETVRGEQACAQKIV